MRETSEDTFSIFLSHDIPFRISSSLPLPFADKTTQQILANCLILEYLRGVTKLNYLSHFSFHPALFFFPTMKLFVRAFVVAMPIAFVVSTGNEPKSVVCRDYLRVKDFFPNGKSCASDNLPTYHDLVSANIEMSTADFLKQHCCAFGGGDRISEDDLVFEQVRKFTGKSVSDFQDQHSPSQKALFWLVKFDSYPNLEDYLHIGQRFALSSIYFGLNGDTDWLECSELADTTCSVQNNKSAWMSGVRECEWAYLSCDRNLLVTEISMRK